VHCTETRNKFLGSAASRLSSHNRGVASQLRVTACVPVVQNILIALDDHDASMRAVECSRCGPWNTIDES